MKRVQNMAKSKRRPIPGEQWTETKTVKGIKRDITYEGRKPFGRNNNLDRVVISNKKHERRR